MQQLSELDVAMASVDADADDAVTTALMAACQDEDVEQVRQLLSADKQVASQQHSCHSCITAAI